MARCYKSKALRLTEELLRDIWNNCYSRDCYLPAEETLAGKYNCSRMTIRKVIAGLVADGVLVKIPSCGARINPELALPGKSTRKRMQKRCIAVVAAAFPDVLTIEVNRGIHDCAAQHDISVILIQNTEGPAALARNLRMLKTEHYLGIICFGNEAGCAAIREFSEKGVPVVSVDNSIDGTAIPYVSSDNMGGMYQAAARLLQHFAEGIFYFGYGKFRHSQAERYYGYCRAMQDHGLSECVSDFTVFVPCMPESGNWLNQEQDHLCMQAAEKLLAQPKPFGVVAESDYLARNLLNVAEKMNLSAGKDFFIISFDDLPLAGKMNLSSIRQPRYELGYEAAQFLLQMIEGQITQGMCKHLPVTLIERGSSNGCR